MITKMKKVNLLVFHQEYDSLLSQLQNLGVVHIQELESGTTSEEFEQLKAKYEEYDEILKRLAKVSAPEGDVKPLEFSDAAEVLTFIKNQLEEQADLNRQLESVTREITIAEPFGFFDKSQAAKLAEAGYQLNLFACPAAKFNGQWVEDFYATIVANTDCVVYFVTFSPEKPVIDAESIELSDKDINELQSEKASLEEKLADVLLNLQSVRIEYSHLLQSAQAEIKNAIQVSRVHLNSQDVAGDKLKLVEGWVPEDKVADVKALLDTTGAYYDVRDAQKGDNVPIKFKNDSYSRMFERLTKMYGFPCYNEWDPTPIVAPFFTLFFAICMGDAGYGLIIFLYGLLDMKGKAKSVPIVGEMLEGCGSMICALGIATMVIGFLLSTFFGINMVDAGWITAETPVVGPVLTFMQSSLEIGTSKYSIQMVAAIVIGIFHICLAMVIKAALYTKKEGFKSQISTWGWVLLLVGGVIVGVLFLFNAFSQQTATMIIIVLAAVSALAIYFLNSVDRLKKSPITGLIINPLAGLYDTYNMASGLMGDILSYIRLYALCLAGGMLGGAFNMIGDMIRGDEGSILLLIPAILIYIVGHIFNLLMSAISAFVHPLRLNFVEYFKNAGYEGKGTAYKPFEIKK